MAKIKFLSKLFLVIVIASVIATTTCVYSADANFKVNYQGYIKSGGIPVNGLKGFKFRIKDGTAGGVQWESSCTDITVSSGFFHATLGETTDSGNWNTINWQNIDAHLEVDIGDASGCGNSATLTPPERLTANVYALSVTSSVALLVDGSTQTKTGGLNVIGNLGVGMSNPSTKLEVSGGTVTATGFSATGAGGGGIIYPGYVGFFDLVSCPSGWSELISGRGMYLVGLNSGGTLGGTVGTALTNLQDRPAGAHTHTLTPNPHTHSSYTPSTPKNGCCSGGSKTIVTSADTGSTSLTVDDTAGTVAGTNAPYVQLLMCIKN